MANKVYMAWYKCDQCKKEVHGSKFDIYENGRDGVCDDCKEKNKLSGSLHPVIQRLDKCKWKKLDGYDREQYYNTECGNSRYFPENDEDILYFKYCPYCGKAIEPIE